jgi:hypothetical protein
MISSASGCCLYLVPTTIAILLVHCCPCIFIVLIRSLQLWRLGVSQCECHCSYGCVFCRVAYQTSQTCTTLCQKRHHVAYPS